MCQKVKFFCVVNISNLDILYSSLTRGHNHFATNLYLEISTCTHLYSISFHVLKLKLFQKTKLKFGIVVLFLRHVAHRVPPNKGNSKITNHYIRSKWKVRLGAKKFGLYNLVFILAELIASQCRLLENIRI